MHDVFISYSSKDFSQAETVRNILEKNGIPCWMAPRDIPGGSNYTKEIPLAIRGCQVFVLILSQNAQDSHWVLKELDSAVNAGKVILPFMLEDCQLNDEFNFLLTGAQRYAAYQKKMEAMETLISRIRAVTATGTTAPAEEAPAPEAPASTPVKAAAGYAGFAVCPACGGDDLVELTKKIGRYTPKEKATLLLSPLFAILGAVVLFWVATTATVFLPSTDTTAMIILLSIPVGGVLGCLLGNKIALERIRRQRVRSHIHPHPFRCRSCQKEFLAEAQ